MTTVVHMPHTRPGSKQTASAAAFRDEAERVLGRLSRSLGRMIAAVPGSIQNASELQHALGLDRALSWQVFRVGTAPDPVEAGADLPRAYPMTKALKAAAARGVPQEIITEARAAYEDYELLVAEHAGERASFDSMIRGLRRTASQVTLKERRSTFRGNRAIWGMHADAVYMCMISHDSGGKQQDNLVILGHVGMRKLRPEGELCAAHRWLSANANEAGPGGFGKRTPLESRSSAVVEAFSTQPLPPLKMQELEPGVVEMALELETIGNAGAITYFVRNIARGVSAGPEPWSRMGHTVRMPAETLVMDMLVPAGHYDATTAHAATYGNLRRPDRAHQHRDEDRIPVGESVMYLGQVIDRLQTPLIPRCPEMIDHLLREQGWHEDRYDIFRCIVKYPILHAAVALRVDRQRE